MKKIVFFASIAAMALASCSSDSLVTDAPVRTDNAQVAMDFSIRRGNMSRDGEVTTKGLESASADFGVWAFKGANDAAIKASGEDCNVMVDYLIGYQNGTIGYIQDPAFTDFTALSTNWFYEALGYADNWTFNALTDVQTAGRKSSVDHQYIKYWDAAQTYTYFYAYAPYIDKDEENRVTFDKTNLKMTFPPINASTGVNYMYASAKCTNSTMISNKAKVNLTFKRLASEIRVAFYGSIKGYNVEICDLSENYADMYFVPSYRTGAGTDEDPYKYNQDRKGHYMSEATPEVNYTDGVGAVSYTGATFAESSFIFDVDGFSYNGTTYASKTKLIDPTNKLYGPKTPVIPASTKADQGNDGLTLNVTLKLTAIGTNEVIYVRGIKCHVPAAYCQWLPNTLYTYVFKITSNVPGNTGGDPEPEPDPSDDPALIPIIFDQIKVVDLDSNEVIYDYFDLDGGTVPAIP